MRGKAGQDPFLSFKGDCQVCRGAGFVIFAACSASPASIPRRTQLVEVEAGADQQPFQSYRHQISLMHNDSTVGIHSRKGCPGGFPHAQWAQNSLTFDD